MSMNTLSLSNIVVGEDLQKSLDKEGLKLSGVFNMLDPVVSRLASLNPLWTFVINSSGLGTGSNRVASGFSIKLDGEELGTIGLSYMGQRGKVSLSVTIVLVRADNARTHIVLWTQTKLSSWRRRCLAR